jgi:hypothetical protein
MLCRQHTLLIVRLRLVHSVFTDNASNGSGSGLFFLTTIALLFFWLAFWNPSWRQLKAQRRKLRADGLEQSLSLLATHELLGAGDCYYSLHHVTSLHHALPTPPSCSSNARNSKSALGFDVAAAPGKVSFGRRHRRAVCYEEAPYEEVFHR